MRTDMLIHMAIGSHLCYHCNFLPWTRCLPWISDFDKKVQEDSLSQILYFMMWTQASIHSATSPPINMPWLHTSSWELLFSCSFDKIKLKILLTKEK